MKIFLKNTCFRNLISKNKLFYTVIQHPFSNNELFPDNKTKTSKSKGSAKVNVKNSSPKKAKKPVKTELERMIMLDNNEVQSNPVPSPSVTSKGKKGKRSKKESETTNITEKENIKTNIRSKVSKKKEEKTDETSTTSTKSISIESIKLGNQYSDLRIDYSLKSERVYENPYEEYIQNRSSLVTKSYILNERTSSCYNYAPLPVVLVSGNGIIVQDVDNYNYVDFLSGYSSLNFGHCNKDILEPVIPQMSQLHMTSRAFHNTLLGSASKILASLFDLDKVLFMNSGVEAGESAVKFARRWGYKVKNIPDNEAEVVFFSGNFWGRTIAACASSDDKSRTNHFGPFDGLKFHIVPYNDIPKLEEFLKERPNICAIMLEPIQGEAGIIIPEEDYLLRVRELCNKYNVLMIVDEIQTAFGRGSGNTTVCRSKNIKPDLLLLGKSLSGGFYPVSAVVGKNEVMDLIRPGEHGSTYGGNPLALRFVYSTLNYLANGKCILEVINKEGIFSSYLKFQSKFIKEIRGRGMMFGIEIFEDSPVSANEIALYLMERGILCKPTKYNILRLSPPIIISENELYKCCKIIQNVFTQLEKLYPNYTAQDKTKFNFQILTPEAAKIVSERLNTEKKHEQELQQKEPINEEVKQSSFESIPTPDVVNEEIISFKQIELNPKESVDTDMKVEDINKAELEELNKDLMNEPNFYDEIINIQKKNKV